jgi:hypothetical protein
MSTKTIACKVTKDVILILPGCSNFWRKSIFMMSWFLRKFEDNKGVMIRSRKLKDKQYTGQKKKKTVNDQMVIYKILYSCTQKTKDRGTLKTGRVSSSYSTLGIRPVTLVANPVISYE